jgi:prostaglandin E receptor 4
LYNFCTRNTIPYVQVGTLATSPVTLLVYANERNWVGGQAMCDYFSFMMIFAGFATVFIIGAMALDRFIAIQHPYFYSAKMTAGRAIYIILSLWIFAFFIACLPLAGIGRNVIHFPGTWCFFSFTGKSVREQLFTYTYTSIGLLVIAMTALCNITVITLLVKMRKKAAKMMPSIAASRSRRHHDSELQMMILLLGIVLIFCTCWVPLMVSIRVSKWYLREHVIRVFFTLKTRNRQISYVT